MQKQTLTLANILADLRIKARENKHLYSTSMIAWLFWSLLFFTTLWFIFFWFIPLPGIALAGLTLFLGMRYTKDYLARHNAVVALRTALERANISIDTERFSHITEEMVVEPHRVGRNTRLTRTAFMVYFESGRSWRKPTVNRLYEWSRTHSLSFAGLDNISLAGDEFYYVTLQGQPDVSYVYPAKFFKLDLKLTTLQAQ